MKRRIAKTIAHGAENRELNGLLAFVLALGLVLAAWLIWITSADTALANQRNSPGAVFTEGTAPTDAALSPAGH
jgi:hypothetical protein